MINDQYNVKKYFFSLKEESTGTMRANYYSIRNSIAKRYFTKILNKDMLEVIGVDHKETIIRPQATGALLITCGSSCVPKKSKKTLGD